MSGVTSLNLPVGESLPESLSRYFDAQNDRNVDEMTDCFAPDAIVRDEGQTYVGRDAIRAWKLDTIARYGVTVRPLSSTEKADGLTVFARVSGNFLGSPADLSDRVVIDESGLIHALEIH
jgi:hypothetical protein